MTNVPLSVSSTFVMSLSDTKPRKGNGKLDVDLMSKLIVPSVSVTFTVKSPAIGSSSRSFRKNTPPRALTLPEVMVKLTGSFCIKVDKPVVISGEPVT